MKSMRSIQISLTHLSLRRFALVGIVGLSLLSAVAADKTVTFEDSDGTVIWTESIKEGECAFPPSDPVKFGYDFTGWSDGSQVKSYAEIDNLPVTAAKTWTATYAPHDGRRLRVIIYSGPGANGGGCMNYHRLFQNNSRIEYKHYHSDRIRTESGLLNTADMLLIPGGTTAEMWSSLDTAGRKAIADFVKTEGGRYFGTCAGTAFLANDNTGSHMKLAPYTLTSQTLHDSVTISLTEKGQEIFNALGWDGSVDNSIYYSSSPIMTTSTSGFEEGTYEFDALATYKSGLNNNHLGKNAIYAGRNQLGRLFLMGPHPEYYEATRKFITVGIRWLFNDGEARNSATADQLKAASTGLAFTLPTDKDAKALKVAWGPAKFTDNGAEELLELVHAIDQHDDYVLTPKTADNITAGQLLAEGYDVLVVPKSQGTYSSDAVTAFANAGGKILYESSDGATGVLRELRATKAAQPVPMEGHEDWGLKYPMLGENNDEVALAFTKTGEDMTWTVPAGVNEIECLVIGGGGGGARNYGGGGGAGGLIRQTNLAVTPGSTLTIRVGAGGAGGVLGDILGKAGASSSVTGPGVSLVAQGGGGGGNAQNPGSNGGSGGGSGGHGNLEKDAGKGVVYAGGAGTDGQGFAGGSVTDFNGTGGAGGGGASAPGAGCSESGVYAGRAGGAGITLEITGVSVGYAGGGGGGGGYNTSAAPKGGTATCGGGAGGAGVKSGVDGGAGSAGTDGTGGGGGGGGRTADGGNGGSGIVIIRYAGTAISGEPAENSWTTQPSISPTSFEEGTTPTLNLGAAAYGTPTANYTAAGIATFAPGEYTLIVTVAATAEYKGLEMQIPFTVTAKTTPPAPPTPTDEVTTNAMANAEWGYAITGLGDDHRDVALVFTNCAANAGMSWTVPDGVTSLRYLVVGGGGAGGSGYANPSSTTRSRQYPDMGGGGGGAGAGFEGTVAVSAHAEIPVTVGAGGIGAVSSPGGDGGESSLTVGEQKIAAAGGGGGGRAVNSSSLAASLAAGRNGGCGGGGSVRCDETSTASTTAKAKQPGGQGGDENHGKGGGEGYVYTTNNSYELCYGGGGGGITEAGHAGGGTTGNRYGGAGLRSSITGGEIVYGGGGGGGGATATAGGNGGAGGGGKGGDNNTVTSTRGCGYPGTDGLGGGGGGGTGYSAATDKSISFAGGNGGSGVVIIRYTLPTTKPITDCTITISQETYTYTGSAITPTVTVTDGGTTLTQGTDYTLSGDVTKTAVGGPYTITVTGAGNYTGSTTKTWSITEAEVNVETVTLVEGAEYYVRFTLLAGATSSASTTWTVPDGVTSLRYLVVGGGGGGGTHKDNGTKGSGTGGGGGGGLLTGTLNDVVGGTTYSITVGNGGAAGCNGGNSALDEIEALGGGHGAGYQSGSSSLSVASNGGSGGGGASVVANGKYGTGTSGQGHDGAGGNSSTDGIGFTGGGGGGAGGTGTKGVSSSRNGGTGGVGFSSDITGVSISYAGGGGGGGGGDGSAANGTGTGGTASGGGGAGGTAKSTTGEAGGNGIDGLGGGGGGCGYNSSQDGGNGGSGVVIIRYTIPNEVPFEQATVTVAEPTVVRFTGEKFSPVVTVTLNGQDITDQCQFSWGGDMINAGLYTLTVRGKPGSEYDGKTANAHPIFQIQPLRSTDYGDWGYTYWYREGNDRYYVTAYTNAPLSKESDVYHPLKPRYLWRVPEGVSSVEILAVGGAGGGSGGSGSNVGGGGQGGSVYRQASFSVTAGKYYEVRLGEGGAGGAANGAGGNGEGTYLYVGTVTKTGEHAQGYDYEKFTRDSDTPRISVDGGTGASAAAGTAGANGANAGSYNIFITDRNYGYGGAKGSGTAAGADGANIYGQGGAGGGTGAAGGKGGDGTLIIRYKVAEATRTAWKHDKQSGDWNTAANWEDNAKPPYMVKSGGAEFYMLDGETVVTVNSAAQAQTLAVNNMAPLTLQINNKLTIGYQSSSSYAYENILIGCGSFFLPMTTLEFTGASSQLNIVPKPDNFGLQIGVGGSREPTAKMSFKIPASGWASQTAAPLYDGVNESPVTIGPACVFEIDATAMTQSGSGNKRCLCYADAKGGVRVTGGANYNFLSLNQWLASGRVQMTVPEGKRGVVVWLDESGNEINPNTASAVTGGIWFYLVDAVDIKNAVVTISKTTAGFTGSPVAEPTVISVKLNGVDITSSCHLVGWKDENGKTVEGSQLTTWGAYTPIVQARPEQNTYGGTVDNDTLPKFEILAAYYHKPGGNQIGWGNVDYWYLDPELTDPASVCPDNYEAMVYIEQSGTEINLVTSADDAESAVVNKVASVTLKGNATDSSKYAVLTSKAIEVVLDKSRTIFTAAGGTSYLHYVRVRYHGSETDDSVDPPADAVAYIDILRGATLGIDSMSNKSWEGTSEETRGGERMVARMGPEATLKIYPGLLEYWAGGSTSSAIAAFTGEEASAEPRTLIVDNVTAQFLSTSIASGVNGPLALQLTLGANNTTENTMLSFAGEFTVGAGSTLTVDAGQKGTGTYTLMTAASGNALAYLAAHATVTNLQPGYKAKFVTTETAGVVTKVDLKIERGLIIIFGSAPAQ